MNNENNNNISVQLPVDKNNTSQEKPITTNKIVDFALHDQGSYGIAERKNMQPLKNANTAKEEVK